MGVLTNYGIQSVTTKYGLEAICKGKSKAIAPEIACMTITYANLPLCIFYDLHTLTCEDDFSRTCNAKREPFKKC